MHIFLSLTECTACYKGFVTRTGEYKVPYPPPALGGKFIKSVGEEYQVGKRGREYHGCGEEYNVEKRERGNNVIFPIKLRLLERTSNGEKGNGTEL